MENFKGNKFYCPNHSSRIVESRYAKFPENDLVSESDSIRDQSGRNWSLRSMIMLLYQQWVVFPSGINIEESIVQNACLIETTLKDHNEQQLVEPPQEEQPLVQQSP